jgi:CheY-like chemotaxis protein
MFRPTPAERRRNFVEAIERARQDGYARITVVVATASAIDCDLRMRGVTETAAGREELARLLRSFVGALVDAAPRGRVAQLGVREQFSNFPFVLLDGNVLDLEAIEAMPNVVGIALDRILKPN